MQLHKSQEIKALNTTYSLHGAITVWSQTPDKDVCCFSRLQSSNKTGKQFYMIGKIKLHQFSDFDHKPQYFNTRMLNDKAHILIN